MIILQRVTGTKVKVDIPIDVKWIRGRDVPDFKQASTSWVFGKRFSGKSTMVETLGTKYMNKGGVVFDVFGARDSESLAWLRSPYNDVLLVAGASVNLKTSYKWVRINEFDLKEAEQHEMVITTPAFYSTEYEMYAALSRFVDLLKWRTVFNKVACLLVREAKNLIASRLMSGKVSNRLEAEFDFIDLHDQAYHTGVAAVIDSLRPISIAPDVREIANYTYIKRMGRMKIPAELYYLLRRVHPVFLRRMKVNEFLLLTDNDDFAVGRNSEVPWHIKRGENLLHNLQIEVERNIAQAKEMEEKKAKPQRDKKVTPEWHNDIMTLKKEGKSYRQIVDALADKNFTLSHQQVSVEVHNHNVKRCSCFIEGVSSS